MKNNAKFLVLAVMCWATFCLSGCSSGSSTSGGSKPDSVTTNPGGKGTMDSVTTNPGGKGTAKPDSVTTNPGGKTN